MLVGVREASATCRRPSVLPSRCIVCARRAFSLKPRSPGVIESITCGTSHDRFSSVIDRWSSTRPRSASKRGWPNGVFEVAAGWCRRPRAPRARRRASRSVCRRPVKARRRAVPWQSAHAISIAVARLAVELAVAVVVLLEVAVHALHAALEVDVLEVHGLAARVRPHARPPSAAVRQRPAGRCSSPPRRALCDDASLTGLPCASSRLPLRSRLNTARNTQPWPWKSANCVCFSCALNSGDPVRCRNAGIRP